MIKKRQLCLLLIVRCQLKFSFLLINKLKSLCVICSGILIFDTPALIRSILIKYSCSI